MRLALAATLVMLTALPAVARDDNRQNYLLGERAAGMGGAFVALTGDATSTYYNPAGLAGLYQKGISLSASAYQVSLESYSRILDLQAGTDRLAGDMTSSTFATFPSSIVYLLPLDANRDPGAFHQVVAFSVLVPDQDKLKAVIDMPVGNLQFELKGTFANQDQTYWIGPTWAMSMGGLRVGFSAFATVHQTEFQANLAVKLGVVNSSGNTEYRYGASVEERSGTTASALLQLGAQLDLTDRWTAGLTIRSPTLGRLYSSVRELAINSKYVESSTGTPLSGYVDRIEVKSGVTLEQRLPLTVAAGLSYHEAGAWAVALDGTFQAAIPLYQRFSGPPAYPTDTSGNPILDPNRALITVEQAEARSVFNLNLGAELYLSKSWIGRAGFFTDVSTVNLQSAAADPSQPRIDRYGVSVGLGRLGERSTTSFSLVYVGGTGQAPGLNAPLGYAANQASVSAQTITAVLSGSADL
jgi:long-chain fatty acid transport protein